MVTNLRYADDTTLLAGTKEDLIELVERVRRASEKAGLYLNVGKTKVMTTGDIGEVTVDGKDIEVVTKFVFLGALITKDGLCEKEVRRRIAMGKSAMGGLTSIWKDRGVTMETKVKLVKVLVFPIVLYGAEPWTMRKHERRKIDAFELWCWRRVLRVSWMERKTNYMDNREHQTGMDTGVKGAKGCIKLLWARGESRRDGRLRDARENEWSEKERKTKTKMAGHTHGVRERSHRQQHETIRQG